MSRPSWTDHHGHSKPGVWLGNIGSISVSLQGCFKVPCSCKHGCLVCLSLPWPDLWHRSLQMSLCGLTLTQGAQVNITHVWIPSHPSPSLRNLPLSQFCRVSEVTRRMGGEDSSPAPPVSILCLFTRRYRNLQRFHSPKYYWRCVPSVHLEEDILKNRTGRLFVVVWDWEVLSI